MCVWILLVTDLKGQCAADTYGLVSGPQGIPDSSLSTVSIHPHCSVGRSRLNTKGKSGSAWCAGSQRSGDWIQVRIIIIVITAPFWYGILIVLNPRVWSVLVIHAIIFAVLAKLGA
jgi:hypothetical protein